MPYRQVVENVSSEHEFETEDYKFLEPHIFTSSLLRTAHTRFGRRLRHIVGNAHMTRYVGGQGALSQRLRSCEAVRQEEAKLCGAVHGGHGGESGKRG